MASMRFANMMIRISGSSSFTLKLLLAGRRLNKMNASHQFARSFSAATTYTADQSSLRRRRRRGGNKSDQDGTTSSSSSPLIPHDASIETIASDTAFSPKDSQGNLLDAQEYLSLASMSPWVPCPDMVIKRVFEIANATDKDVHVDLGCGDGRLNFAAVDGPHYVQSSWGVDVDQNILDKCHERNRRRFVPRSNVGDLNLGGMSSKKNESDEMSSSKLEFLQADLKLVIERQKEIYQQQQQQLEQQQSQSSSDGNKSSTNKVNQNGNKDGSKEDDITSRLSQSTLVTMYFVHDALQQLQPYLASTLGGKEHIRVITVGYEMKGWEASWVERVLGLTIFKYDMENVSSDPLEWRVNVGDNDKDDDDVATVSGNENSLKAEIDNFDGDYYDNVDIDDDEPSELAKYLKQKREQDMEELNAGLEIHHDEALNDFAQFRSKGGNNSTTTNRDHIAPSSRNNNNAPSIAHDDGGGDDDDDLDFDETEDPEEVMRKAQKEMAEAKMGGRGKGMMTGVDTAKKNKLDGRGGGKGGGGETTNNAKNDVMDTR